MVAAKDKAKYRIEDGYDSCHKYSLHAGRQDEEVAAKAKVENRIEDGHDFCHKCSQHAGDKVKSSTGKWSMCFHNLNPQQ